MTEVLEGREIRAVLDMSERVVEWDDESIKNFAIGPRHVFLDSERQDDHYYQ
jgi:hypothetical protein